MLVAQHAAPPLDDVSVELLGLLQVPFVPMEVGALMRGSKRLGVVVAQTRRCVSSARCSSSLASAYMPRLV